MSKQKPSSEKTEHQTEALRQTTTIEPEKDTVALQDLPHEIDPQIKTIWVDAMNVIGYQEANTISLYFQTAIMFPPNARRLQEAARIQMTRHHAISMIEVLCKYLNHYPTPPPKESGSKDQKSTP